MQTTTANALLRGEHADEPLALPFCSYPTAADGRLHGVQRLPDALPRVDFARVAPYRSRRHATVPATRLTTPQIDALALVVAGSFARREPQCRHLRPAKRQPAALATARHDDAFGSASFGPWNLETLLYWFIRTLIFTDPTSPRGAIQTNQAALEQSLAIQDEHGAILGGALNETLLPHDAPPAFRADDPFLGAVLDTIGPVIELLAAQDAAALAALCGRYADFAAALHDGRVGHHFMVARADALPTRDAFELVAATAQHYQALGFGYVIVEATNQWTGAACELLNGVRVHFAPFRADPVLPATGDAPEHAASSPDGYIAAKDSGSMLYVLRVA